MAARPQLTDAGLLAESYGERPFTVALREEKMPGTPVLLDYTVAGGRRRKRSLGYAVRRKAGRRWVWDWDRLEEAREAARDRSAELRLRRLREDVQPQSLTVGEAFALYHDPDRGAVPTSKSARAVHKRARREWTAWLGSETQWNQIARADVEALARRFRERGMIPTAIKYVEVLRTLFHWLDQKTNYEGLKNPTKGFPWKEIAEGHKPNRPRFTAKEARAIVRVRHQVDPRFALFIALMDDSGARGKAIRTTWRSAVDAPLDVPPSAEDAPYGWIVFPALKGQAEVLHFLTPFERREIELAFDGYLRELEERWQERGIDYPLFPGVRLADMKERVVRPNQPGAHKPCSDSLALLWLSDAQKVAKIDHVRGRGYHGIRRGWSDHLFEETDLKTLTTAGGWSTQRTPEQIYIERHRHRDRARAREAMERKRREELGNDS